MRAKELDAEVFRQIGCSFVASPLHVRWELRSQARFCPLECESTIAASALMGLSRCSRASPFQVCQGLPP